MQCRRVDNGAIFDLSLSSSTFIGLDTQKPIDIATVHSSQNIFDSTVGIIIKLRLNTVNTKCLIYLTSIIHQNLPRPPRPRPRVLK